MRQTHQYGPHALTVMGRRTPEQTTAVNITLQASYQEIWDSFWNFGGQPVAPAAEHAALPPPPDLLGLDVWPAADALCSYLAANPELVAGEHVLELGAGAPLGPPRPPPPPPPPSERAAASQPATCLHSGGMPPTSAAHVPLWPRARLSPGHASPCQPTTHPAPITPLPPRPPPAHARRHGPAWHPVRCAGRRLCGAH